MLNPRIGAGSVVFDGRFYILGGYQCTDNPSVMRVLNSVECYSPSSDEWQLLPPMLQPRMNPRGVLVIGRCLYIVDGVDYGFDGEDGELVFDPDAALEPYAEKYDPSLQAWVALPERLGPRPTDFVAVTAVSDFLYLMGGAPLGLTYGWGAAVALTQRYDSRSNAWELISPMPVSYTHLTLPTIYSV